MKKKSRMRKKNGQTWVKSEKTLKSDITNKILIK